jgi:F-type H+-transporting ATPase subunit b
MISLNATLIVQVVNFLLLMWILNRLLFGPILKSLGEREGRIKRHQENMKDLASRAQEAKEGYGASMERAQAQAAKAKEMIVQEGAGDAEKTVKRVSTEAEKSLAETKAAVARGAEKARGEFGGLSKEISLKIYRKVLGME